MDNNGSSVGPNRWANPDFVFPLDRPKPATQPAEDPALMP